MRFRFLNLVVGFAALVILGAGTVGHAQAQEPQAANPAVSAHPDGTIPSPAAPQALTEGERCSVDSLHQRITIIALRAELARAQARIAELEAPLVDQAVVVERQQLEQRFRARLKPADGSTFDWSTLTFVVPKTPTETPPQAPPVK